ncbi:helix-turn-helix domain-containing protein [Flavobacterium channae]|uniref:helix-turn-helix domain-containing protein n=1 Tax=Flavobacterium channae TaxID=2897181 RepID=UPI001E3FB669|nr:helix-turn-helix transcriptional regulator [Flavobacterium channae]UGS24829.1 helix-turn-helix domain-containing protein [Flavobacterium channae]
MVNIDDFIKRLEIILEYYNLSASAFADKINVQRSSLSHLLSGRNKPSLDFIIKVIDVFPEVDLYWILNGNGTFPKSDAPSPLQNEVEKIQVENSKSEINTSEPDLFSTIEQTSVIASSEKRVNEISNFESPNNQEIERIVIFFKNGTFKNYKP